MKYLLCFCVTVLLCATVAALHHSADLPIAVSGLRIEAPAAKGLQTPTGLAGIEASNGHLICASYRPEMLPHMSAMATASRTDISLGSSAAGSVALACRNLPAKAAGLESSMVSREIRAEQLYRR